MDRGLNKNISSFIEQREREKEREIERKSERERESERERQRQRQREISSIEKTRSSSRPTNKTKDVKTLQQME